MNVSHEEAAFLAGSSLCHTIRNYFKELRPRAAVRQRDALVPEAEAVCNSLGLPSTRVNCALNSVWAKKSDCLWFTGKYLLAFSPFSLKSPEEQQQLLRTPWDGWCLKPMPEVWVLKLTTEKLSERWVLLPWPGHSVNRLPWLWSYLTSASFSVPWIPLAGDMRNRKLHKVNLKHKESSWEYATHLKWHKSFSQSLWVWAPPLWLYIYGSLGTSEIRWPTAT